MSDWRNSVSEERPAFGLGDLTADDEFVLRFLDEGHLTETRHGEALEVGVAVQEAPDGYEDMNGSPVEEGEDYNLMTSSSRFQYALKEYADELTGNTATVRAEGESFDRTYFIE